MHMYKLHVDITIPQCSDSLVIGYLISDECGLYAHYAVNWKNEDDRTKKGPFSYNTDRFQPFIESLAHLSDKLLVVFMGF